MICLSGCSLQRALLYQPDNYTLDTARAMAERAGLQLWPLDNASYRGLVTPPPGEPSRGTVVVFHGNAGSAAFRSFYTAALVPQGYRVLLAEYPGYGARQGSLSEANLAADAAETLQLAREAFDSPVIAWGESLGSAVIAAAMARSDVNPDGLVLFAPWDSLLNLARSHFPYLPVRFFLQDKYNNIANVAEYPGRTAVILAGRDEVVPTALGRRLYESLSGEKALWIMEEVGHNDWETSPDNPLWREVMNYVHISRKG